MTVLIRREFIVDAPLIRAWQHLANVQRWPSWARHIKQVEVRPAGEIGPGSKALIRLIGGLTCRFVVTEFNPHCNWKWLGRFLWLTVHYDHGFDELDPLHTRLTWIIAASGFGERFLGRLTAHLYSHQLDRAIPLLIAEMKAA